jgi:hypothetical protein
VWEVAVSPDGQRVVSGGDHGTVRVWDAASDKFERALEGNIGWVRAVAFGPDGQPFTAEGLSLEALVQELTTSYEMKVGPASLCREFTPPLGVLCDSDNYSLEAISMTVDIVKVTTQTCDDTDVCG